MSCTGNKRTYDENKAKNGVMERRRWDWDLLPLLMISHDIYHEKGLSIKVMTSGAEAVRLSMKIGAVPELDRQTY